MTTKPTITIGTRVHYRGDICNAPRDGAVTAIEQDQFGSWATVAWDDPETCGLCADPGGFDGEVRYWRQKTDRISIHSIKNPSEKIASFVIGN